jgi:hypothetical protein
MKGTDRDDAPSGFRGGRCEAFGLLGGRGVCWLGQGVSDYREIKRDTYSPLSRLSVVEVRGITSYAVQARHQPAISNGRHISRSGAVTLMLLRSSRSACRLRHAFIRRLATDATGPVGLLDDLSYRGYVQDVTTYVFILFSIFILFILYSPARNCCMLHSSPSRR